jgi:hypothetical protein
MSTARKDLDVTAIVRAYHAGDGPTEIGRRYGVTGQTIRNRLRDAGVPLRPPIKHTEILAARLAEVEGIDALIADEIVHEAAARLGANANNGGPGAQAAFLIRHLGFKGALAAINEYA